MTKYLVIYDGDCGFCESTVNLIKRLDWLRKFDFVPFQKDSVFKEYKQLTAEMCKKEIFLVKPNGSYFGGYDAFRIVFVFLPLTFVLSWIFFLPGVTQAGRLLYKVIAENRHRIKIGSNVCKPGDK